MRQDIGSDVDQVTAQGTLTPFSKHCTFLRGRHAQILHESISFTNHLHVGIFNAVVNHFDKVTSTTRSHPFTTGLAVVSFGSNGL